jgi:hypothetical protein
MSLCWAGAMSVSSYQECQQAFCPEIGGARLRWVKLWLVVRQLDLQRSSVEIPLLVQEVKYQISSLLPPMEAWVPGKRLLANAEFLWPRNRQCNDRTPISLSRLCLQASCPSTTSITILWMTHCSLQNPRPKTSSSTQDTGQIQWPRKKELLLANINYCNR